MSMSYHIVPCTPRSYVRIYTSHDTMSCHHDFRRLRNEKTCADLTKEYETKNHALTEELSCYWDRRHDLLGIMSPTYIACVLSCHVDVMFHLMFQYDVYFHIHVPIHHDILSSFHRTTPYHFISSLSI